MVTGADKVIGVHTSLAPGESSKDTRWDFSVTFLHEDGAESGSYAIPDPYANQDQRSLCNKCHAKDFGDSGSPGQGGPGSGADGHYNGTKFPARFRG